MILKIKVQPIESDKPQNQKMQGKISNVKDKPVKAWKRILEVEKFKNSRQLFLFTILKAGAGPRNFRRKKIKTQKQVENLKLTQWKQ